MRHRRRIPFYWRGLRIRLRLPQKKKRY